MTRLVAAVLVLVAGLAPASAQSLAPPEFEAYLRSQLDPRTFVANLHQFAIVMVDDGAALSPMVGTDAAAQAEEAGRLATDFELFEFEIFGYSDDGLYVTVVYTYRAVLQLPGSASAGTWNVTEVFQHEDDGDGWLLVYSLTAKVD